MDNNTEKIPFYANKPSNTFLQIIYSFAAAFAGLFHVLLTQRNMRFHFSIAIWVMSFAIIFDLEPFQKAFLFIVVTFVFSMEILNTCIEALVDLLSPEYNKYAKIAKDTAAAAVLSVSIGSVMSAGYLLFPPFFTNIVLPEWRAEHIREIIAIGAVIAAVFTFWGLRAMKLFPLFFLYLGTTASGVSLALMSFRANDWISFTALQFFSTLLFNSMARTKNSLPVSLAGHITGIAAYFFIAFQLKL